MVSLKINFLGTLGVKVVGMAIDNADVVLISSEIATVIFVVDNCWREKELTKLVSMITAMAFVEILNWNCQIWILQSVFRLGVDHFA